MNSTAALPTSDSMDTFFTPWRFALCLLAIVLCGALLRCWQAGESLWLDELHTSWVVADLLSVIPQRARAGNQSPLYFYLVWGVVQLCGHSEWALRLTSLTAGVGLIAGAALLVRRWSGSAVSGLLAALLVALDRDCIFFAQEARPYALVQLSALCHSALFVAMLQRPTATRRLLFVCGAAWLFYLHYTAFLVLVAQAVCLVLIWSFKIQRVEYRLSQALCDGLLVAVLLVPSAAHVHVIAERKENWERIVQAWPPPYSLQVATVLFALLPLLTVLLGHVCRWKRTEFSLRSPPAFWAACWFAVPVTIAWITTFHRFAALCMVRYLVASVVGAIVFAALCHSVFASRWYRAVLAALLVVAVVWNGGTLQQVRRDGRVIGDRNEAWDEASHWLDEQLQRHSAPVFLCSWLLEDEGLRDHDDPQLVEYCLFPLSGIYQIDAPYLSPLPSTDQVSLTPQQFELAVQRGGLWLVVRAGPISTEQIATSVCRAFHRHGYPATVLEQRRFGVVAVLRLNTGY